MLRKQIFTITAAVLCVPGVLLALGDGNGFELSKSALTGGQVETATGNGFDLRGTMGVVRPELPGGQGFTLISGFWHEIAPSDCDEDGSVSLSDYQAFEMCLTGPGMAVDAGCGCYDVNANGAIELGDFAASQVSFTGQ